jgi:predicted nucleotidyltransferase
MKRNTPAERGKVKRKKDILIDNIKEVVEKDKEVLFAYLYGSSIFQSIPFDSDIDVAVYLKPSDIKSYIVKEEGLTSALIAKLHTDKIDLRILNTVPFLLEYNVLKEGIPIFVRDESERVDFEIRVMNRFFELKPYLDEYKRMLSLRIEVVI